MTSRLGAAGLILAATVVAIGLLLISAPVADAGATCRNAKGEFDEIGAAKAQTATRCLINQKRVKRGMKPLRADRALTRAARRHSRRMVKQGCFAHVCSGEALLRRRVTDAGYLPCGCSFGLGETIAVGPGSNSTPSAVVRTWMRSAAHRAVLLTRRYRDIGIGTALGSPTGAADARTYTADLGYKR